MAKAQSEAERQKIKEEEKALRARERDAAALANAGDESAKLATQIDALQVARAVGLPYVAHGRPNRLN